MKVCEAVHCASQPVPQNRPSAKLPETRQTELAGHSVPQPSLLSLRDMQSQAHLHILGSVLVQHAADGSWDEDVTGVRKDGVLVDRLACTCVGSSLRAH